MNNRAFKAKLVLKGYSVCELAELLKEKGIELSPSAIYKKLRGASEFSRKEIKEISIILEISNQEMMDIFFNHEVS